MSSSRRALFVGWLLVATLFVGFFGKLFWPEPKIFSTVELVRSDIFHYHYPVKAYLGQSLKQGRIPFWNPQWGNGFPIFAEAQMGTFFVPNLILFGLLPTWMAWNLSFVLITGICLWGSYLFIKDLGKSDLSALIAATVFSFSGYFVLRYVHLSAIQATALLPWIFYWGNQSLKRPSLRSVTLLALCISQQIYTGYYQSTLSTYMAFGLYVAVTTYHQKQLLKRWPLLVLSLVLGLGLSLPQILPTLELVQESRREFEPNWTTQMPFRTQDLLYFLSPILEGSPKDAGWVRPPEQNGVYWENTYYFGLIALLLSLWALYKTRTQPRTRAILSFMVWGLFLSLAHNFSLDFVYQLPGISLFRVQARYLIITVWGLIIGLAFGLDLLVTKLKTPHHWVILSIGVLLGVDLYFHYGNYNMTSANSIVIEPPQISQLIPATARVGTHDSVRTRWEERYTSHGWTDPRPFEFLLNGLDVNYHGLWSWRQWNVYAGMIPFRSVGYAADPTVPKLLNMGVEYYITATQVPNLDPYQLTQTLTGPDNLNLYIYTPNELPDDLRFAEDIRVHTDLTEARWEILRTNFDPFRTAIIETEVATPVTTASGGVARFANQTSESLVIETASDEPRLLLINMSYYPSWHAYLGDQEIPLHPANTNQSAVIVPPGNNQIELRYIQTGFRTGVLAAGISAFVLLGLYTPPINSRFRRWFIS